MKYIEIDSRGKKIQFTTRSAFIDGKEYPYSQMSSVRYSLEKRVYAFKCGDEVQYIHYEEKDAKALNAIFSQIRKMHQKRDAAQAAAKAAVPSGTHAFSVADVMDGKDQGVDTAKFTTRISVQDLLKAQQAEATEGAAKAAEIVEAAAKAAQAEVEEKVKVEAIEPEAKAEDLAAAVEAEATEVAEEAGEEAKEAAEAVEEAAEPAEEAKEAGEEVKAEAEDAKAKAKAEAEEAKAKAKAEAEEAKAKAKAEKERLRAEKEQAKKEKAEAKAKAKLEKAAAAGEEGRQSRFKKAIIIFVVVLMFFVALGCAWYAAVGFSNNPSSGPNSTESQSYDDIDQMIQDLEE